jgi:flagellar motor switch protein FliG
MSKRAAQMVQEDMGFMGAVGIQDVKKCQEEILNITRHLEQVGEIVIP